MLLSAFLQGPQGLCESKVSWEWGAASTIR